MPIFLVFFGLIASGKSTLAESWADKEGYLYLNTDRVRKELAGFAVTERCADGLEQGIYTPEYTRRTYQAMLDRAEGRLRLNGNVVLDGSYSCREDRGNVLKYEDSNGVLVRFVHCFCSENETRRRLTLRAQDPLAVSDGRWDIYLQQKKRFEPPRELDAKHLLTINTEDDLGKLLSAIGRWLSSHP